MSIDAEAIIAQMDQYARDYLFPMPDNADQYNAGMRLTAFHDSDEWLIIFEMLNYIKGREFLNEIYAFGDRLICPGLQPRAVTVLEPIEGQPFWDCFGSFTLNLEAFTLKIKGTTRQVMTLPPDWQAAGIREDSPAPVPAKLLRFMAALYQGELLRIQCRCYGFVDGVRAACPCFCNYPVGSILIWQTMNFLAAAARCGLWQKRWQPALLASIIACRNGSIHTGHAGRMNIGVGNNRNMARWDARFYYLDWRYFNKLNRDFGEMCLDDEGQVRAEYRAWLQEEENVAGDLTNWKVSREACELYEELRGQLPSAGRYAIWPAVWLCGF